ncbi:MAG: hypothetical protein WDM79_02070 [Terricaulis sp.]
MNWHESWSGRFTLAILGFAIAHVGVGLAVEHYLPDQSFINIVVIGIAQAAISLTVAFVILTWHATVLWREGKILYDHGVAIGKGVGGRRRVKRSILAFLHPRLDAHLKDAQKLFGEGLPITKNELADLITAAFSSRSGTYIGTDKNVPSEFFRLYPLYLQRQTRGRDSRGDFRFLLATAADLQADYTANTANFREFVSAHETSGIKLLQVDPARAQRMHETVRLPAEEIGVYGNDYVVFFSHSTNDHFVISIRLLEQPLQRGSPDKLREAVELYLADLNEDAREITFGHGGNLLLRERETDEKSNDRARLTGALDRKAKRGAVHAS